MPWPRRLAVATASLTGAVLAAGCVLAVVAPVVEGIGFLAVMGSLGMGSTALGLLISSRRPANRVGFLLTLVGFAPCVNAVADAYSLASLRHVGALPAGEVVISLSQGAQMWFYVPIALLVLRFPDGRVPGRRWRWVGPALVLDAIAVQLFTILDPDPYLPPYEQSRHVLGVLPPEIANVGYLLLALFLALLAACAASMIARFRSADGFRRAQLKWFSLAGLWVPGTLLACWAEYVFTGQAGGVIVGVGLVLLYAAVPAATAIAILRHDLYDIDRVLSGTVTYGAVTVALVGVFAAVSFAGGLAFGEGSAVTAAAATATCALALAPLRARLQRVVDRRLYPVRSTALAAIDDLARRTYTGEAQPEQIEEVLQEGLGDPSLRVGLVVPGATGLVGLSGEPLETAGAACVPVELGGQRIGGLVHGAVTSRELLREVADASALLVEVTRLRLEVKRALGEVESSRRRLLQIGYRERRLLERDLHDGAQQRLVSLGMALRLAQRHLDDGSVDVDGLIDQTVAELGTAVAELRQIAHGLRPSSLDDGLGPALAGLANAVPVPMDLDVSPGDEVPDTVATTAFYVASEAVTNSVKHARADRIALRVAQSNGYLRVRVEDDGRGGADSQAGSGLSGLADRVAALGGFLRIDSAPGQGTVVEATLPCGS